MASWLRRMDWTAQIWRKEADPGAPTRTPTEIAVKQLGFTPYADEDVGQRMSESNDRLSRFSSDFPHVEGGRDPIGHCEQFLADADGAAPSRDRIYAENFARLFAASG